tara:strand:+ start:16051 stop:20016 length:3966 start_codon:yes stop_codon:yes gene_type:complete
MPYINDRVFGADIVKSVKDTLQARQKGSTVLSPNESIDYTQNFTSTPGSNLDLSSRKPWARMWTVIRGYTVSNCEEVPTSIGCDPKNPDKKYGRSYDNHNVVIYEVGNNVYDDYNKENTINETVNRFMPSDFLSSNQFMRPQAGITSIQSTSQGTLGVYVDTVINFKVYNYFDYSHIFSKFFLYPGAQVFVDMGWDTSLIYNQKDYFVPGEADPSAEDLYGKWKEDLYGLGGGDDQKDGLMSRSGGDLNVIDGYVVDFSSTSQYDGSFDCSVTITSRNNALVSYEQKGRTNMSKVFTRDITRVLMTHINEKYDIDVRKLNFINNVEDVSEQASNFYKIMLENASKSKEIKAGMEVAGAGSEYNEMGELITYQPTSLIKYKEISSYNQTLGIYYQATDGGNAPSGTGFDKFNNDTFITIRFLEDELLNKYLGITYEGKEDNDKADDKNKSHNILFDSTNQYAKFDKNIYMLQITAKNYSSLDFLYPSIKYNKIKDEHAVRIRDLWINVSMMQSSLSNQSSIKNALNTMLDRINKASNGVMKLVLIGSSSGVKIIDMNNPLIGTDQQVLSYYKEGEVTAYLATGELQESPAGNAVTRAVNRLDRDVSNYGVEDSFNKPLSNYDFENLFIFSPYSKKSLVMNMNLSLSMPSNTMSTVLSINATSLDNQIYPNSREVLSILGLKDMHMQTNDTEDQNDNQAACSDDLTGRIGYEWLPILSKKVSTRTMEEISDTSIPDPRGVTDAYGADDDMLDSISNAFTNWLKSPPSGSLEAQYDEEIKKLQESYNSVVTEIKNKKEELNKKNAGEVLDKENLIQILRDIGVDSGEVIFANNIEEYFRNKVTSNIVPIGDNRSSMVLPYTLNLTLYGISGIVPGNVFRVDYLPEVYRDKIVFIAEKVTHNFSSGQWVTSIDAYTMYRSDKMFECGFKPDNIHVNWNPNLLHSYGYSIQQIKEFIKNPDKEWWGERPDLVNEFNSEKIRKKDVHQKARDEKKRTEEGYLLWPMQPEKSCVKYCDNCGSGFFNICDGEECLGFTSYPPEVGGGIGQVCGMFDVYNASTDQPCQPAKPAFGETNPCYPHGLEICFKLKECGPPNANKGCVYAIDEDSVDIGYCIDEYSTGMPAEGTTEPYEPPQNLIWGEFSNEFELELPVIYVDTIYIDPTTGHPDIVTSPFGMRTEPVSGASTNHTGVDFRGAVGEPVLAAADGTIVQVAEQTCNAGSACAGKYISIDHGNFVTRYFHLNTYLGTEDDGSTIRTSEPGMTVISGQKIADIGQTGNVSGPHLHFAVWKKPPGWVTDYSKMINESNEPGVKGYQDPYGYLSKNYNV